MKRGLALALAVASLLWSFSRSSSATVFHVVRQGDTVNSLASEYYGNAKRAVVIRAANSLPLDEDIELSVGEPLVIPESTRRIVKEGESWDDLARLELGAPSRGWYLAKVNDLPEDSPPPVGKIVNVPYLMPLALSEGLAATIDRFIPTESNRDRVNIARELIKLNQGLRPRGTPRGTRIVIPIADLTILPEKRAAVEQTLSGRRSLSAQTKQQEATEQLERLPALLGSGSYVELVLLAGRISGSSELTEAQEVTLHRYLGQALLALDRPQLAEQEFTALLGLQPDFQFDQVTTSPLVLDLLERARSRRGRPTESSQ